MATKLPTDAEIRRIIGKPTNAYDTHRPVLAEAIIHTTGAILELGMGEGSTPGLHEIAKITGREVFSYEDDAAWFEKMPCRDSLVPHWGFLVSDWDQAAITVEPTVWAVAFVDHGKMARRVKEIGRVANNSEIVVVHDTEDWRYQYWSIYGLFKYRFDYMKIRPWTTAFSNSIDVSQWTIP